MTKKIIVGTGILAVAAFFATTFIASAQTTTSVNGVANPKPQVLNVGKDGNVLLRGTIVSITNGSMTVSSWGGTWTVVIPSSASIYPVGTTNYATEFQVGDFVGIQGSIASNANWTVNAQLVRDWTYRATLTTQEQTNAHTAQGIRSGYPRDYIGVASNVGASSLTLTTSNGAVYTVNLETNAEVVSRNWATLPFANIQNGDHVRVYGVNASSTVTAQIVRDVTIR